MPNDSAPVRPGPKNPPPRIRDRPYLVQPKLPPGQTRPGQRVVPPAPRKQRGMTANDLIGPRMVTPARRGRLDPFAAMIVAARAE